MEAPSGLTEIVNVAKLPEFPYPGGVASFPQHHGFLPDAAVADVGGEKSRDYFRSVALVLTQIEKADIPTFYIGRYEVPM